jgi:hypothetical protein
MASFQKHPNGELQEVRATTFSAGCAATGSMLLIVWHIVARSRFRASYGSHLTLDVQQTLTTKNSASFFLRSYTTIDVSVSTLYLRSMWSPHRSGTLSLRRRFTHKHRRNRFMSCSLVLSRFFSKYLSGIKTNLLHLLRCVGT